MLCYDYFYSSCYAEKKTVFIQHSSLAIHKIFLVLLHFNFYTGGLFDDDYDSQVIFEFAAKKTVDFSRPPFNFTRINASKNSLIKYLKIYLNTICIFSILVRREIPSGDEYEAAVQVCGMIEVNFKSFVAHHCH